MKKILERVVKSLDAPLTTDLWLNPKTNELKHFENNEWKKIAGGSDGSDGGDGEDGSGSDFQVVNLSVSGNLPKTGTMSAEDKAKLVGDNCVLSVNGTYFYKSYGSSGGVDYNEYKLAKTNDNIRTRYFTMDADTGEYTLAYSIPVEANVQTSDNLPSLQNIKVGNTTYAIPSAGGTMVVHGQVVNDNLFVPVNGEPTWSEASTLFENGGNITLAVQGGDYLGLCRIVARHPEQSDEAAALQFWMGSIDCYWLDPNFIYPIVG